MFRKKKKKFPFAGLYLGNGILSFNHFFDLKNFFLRISIILFIIKEGIAVNFAKAVV